MTWERFLIVWGDIGDTYAWHEQMRAEGYTIRFDCNATILVRKKEPGPVTYWGMYGYYEDWD